MNPTARKRSSNFSKEEELLLLEEIGKVKKIIENKTTNSVTGAEKNEAWRKVLARFNAKNSQNRNLEQIKAKFDNLKTKARKWAGDNKKDQKGTGGGPATVILTLDPVTEAVLNIINHKTVYGLTPTCDDDFNEAGNIELLNQSNFPEGDEQTATDVFAVYADDMEPLSNERYSIRPQEVLDETIIAESTKNGSIFDKVKKAVNKEIKESTTLPDNWSTYSTRKLKEPVNKRLRPKVANPTFIAREQYYLKKAELVQLEIDELKRKRQLDEAVIEEEKLLRKRREDWEAERHNKEMELLNLKIKNGDH